MESAFTTLERSQQSQSTSLLESVSANRILETEVSSAVAMMQLLAESVRLDMRTVSDAIHALEGKLGQGVPGVAELEQRIAEHHHHRRREADNSAEPNGT